MVTCCPWTHVFKDAEKTKPSGHGTVSATNTFPWSLAHISNCLLSYGCGDTPGPLQALWTDNTYSDLLWFCLRELRILEQIPSSVSIRKEKEPYGGEMLTPRGKRKFGRLRSGYEYIVNRVVGYL